MLLWGGNALLDEGRIIGTSSGRVLFNSKKHSVSVILGYDLRRSEEEA